MPGVGSFFRKYSQSGSWCYSWSMTEYEQRIETLKSQGASLEATIVRDIFYEMPPRSEVHLKEAQATAWAQVKADKYSRSKLRSTRASLHEFYGLMTKRTFKKANYLQLTDLGREFAKWLDDPSNNWGRPEAQELEAWNRKKRLAGNPSDEKMEELLGKPAPTIAPSKPVERIVTDEAGMEPEDYIEQLKKDLGFPQVGKWGKILDKPVPWSIYRHLNEAYIQEKDMELALLPRGYKVVVLETLDEVHTEGRNKGKPKQKAHYPARWSEDKSLTDLEEELSTALEEVNRLNRENSKLRTKLGDEYL